MKLTITFKTPDAGEYEIDELIKSEIDKQITNGENDPSSYDKEEKDEMYMRLESEIREKLSKFIKYKEYIYIEFDLENGIAKVLGV